MPRANAEDHLIDVASDADVLTFLKLIIPRAAKVPAAITKKFIHCVYLPFMILLYHTLEECQRGKIHKLSWNKLCIITS